MPKPVKHSCDLIKYNEQHKVLICQQCQYAVQKSALESHLLRHKIYRGERQALISSLAHLEIVEPDKVLLPTTRSAPVEGLSVLDGYRCQVLGCGHLTGSLKRMRQHRLGAHKVVALGTESSVSVQPVTMQTFFRGTKLRYFEVSEDGNSSYLSADVIFGGLDSVQNAAADDRIKRKRIVNPCLRKSSQTLSYPQTEERLGVTDRDLDTLADFHHFTTVVCHSLPSPVHTSAESSDWQTHVVPKALGQLWVMCGLLAISTYHMASYLREAEIEKIYLGRAAEFASQFRLGMEQTSRNQEPQVHTSNNASDIDVHQISCLLQCAQWRITGFMAISTLRPSVQLTTVLSCIRNCVNAGQASDSSPCRGARSSKASRGRKFVALIAHLHSLPSNMAHTLGIPTNIEDVSVALSVTARLIENCETEFKTASQAVWQGSVSWLVQLPARFIQQLEDQSPMVLIIVAYWAVSLAKRVHQANCWLLRDHAERIISLVSEILLSLDDDLSHMVRSFQDSSSDGITMVSNPDSSCGLIRTDFD